MDQWTHKLPRPDGQTDSVTHFLRELRSKLVRNDTRQKNCTDLIRVDSAAVLCGNSLVYDRLFGLARIGLTHEWALYRVQGSSSLWCDEDVRYKVCRWRT